MNMNEWNETGKKIGSEESEVNSDKSPLENQIIDNYTKICICKSISRATMKKVIKEGALTLNQVRYKTGAGSGPCQGRRCTPRIEHLLEQHKEGKF